MIEIIVKYKYPDTKKDRWVLYKPVNIILSNGEEITIPEGFVSDFASIPQFLWSILPPVGNSNIATLVHDFLYDTKYKNDRLFADKEMFFWMRKYNNSLLKTCLYFWGVRLFGKGWWNK